MFTQDCARQHYLENCKKQFFRNKNILSKKITACTKKFGAADLQIDTLVYDLYSLTPEEIKIVEGG